MICGSIDEFGDWKIPKTLSYQGEKDECNISNDVPLTGENTTIKYKHLVEHQWNYHWEPEKDHELNLGIIKEPINIKISNLWDHSWIL